ncbi:MAG: response regulator [Candidatus Omnitrophica bacterium]|nr:response regulator [Candidatus Omnitrophota bacterium]
MDKEKILLIEDERDMAYAVTLQLEAEGYDVINAYDGYEGFQKAKSDKPNLIILDLMLPKIEGYKVCRMLKFDDKYKSIPIILFTSRAQESDRETSKEVGADAYVAKPFEPEILLSKIKELLKTKSKV